MEKVKNNKLYVQKNKRKIKVFIMEEVNKNIFLAYINELKKANLDIET